MLTPEGKNVSRDCPHCEYPTPQFRRDSYYCLNGPWLFGLDFKPENHEDYPSTILVPFAPETPLSGIHKRIEKGQTLHYKKVFSLPFGFNKGRVLLHFEAVDQVCDVYLNGVKIAHHEGGYTPFTVDCMELNPGENELLVDVWDDVDSPIYPRGKQSKKSKGIWYTSTSGIWGTVWLESVPKEVIQSLTIVPLFDQKKVSVRVRFEGVLSSSQVEASFAGRTLAKSSLDEKGQCELDLSSLWRPWSPESPFLYDLKVTANQDQVSSYFAMRKFSIVERNGFPVFALNNEPYFLSGVLDQGYYPDGGLTAPSDKALINDISLVKSMGYNTIRKHLKIEEMRWYYHCDRLGVIVLQDFVSSGDPVKKRLYLTAPFIRWKIDDTKSYRLLGRESEQGRAFFEQELERVVERLKNVPSIASWTLFNEGWGQFDSLRLTQKLKELDPTRLVDSTSGWFDQGAGDFDSRHVYFKRINLHGDGRRVLALTEFGALSHRAGKEHCFSNKRTLYRYFRSKQSLGKAIESLYAKQVIPMMERGLSMAIMTQLSDVEQETNGLVTYDRRVVKLSEQTMRSINAKLRFGGKSDD